MTLFEVCDLEWRNVEQYGIRTRTQGEEERIENKAKTGGMIRTRPGFQDMTFGFGEREGMCTRTWLIIAKNVQDRDMDQASQVYRTAVMGLFRREGPFLTRRSA